MYYVPDGTKECGYYECKKCGNRFLSMQTMKRIPCPDCEAEIDYEIGPDESLEDVLDTAELIEKIEGEEVEKMDALLSLAVTGGDYNWISTQAKKSHECIMVRSNIFVGLLTFNTFFVCSDFKLFCYQFGHKFLLIIFEQ